MAESVVEKNLLSSDFQYLQPFLYQHQPYFLEFDIEVMESRRAAIQGQDAETEN